MAHATAVQKETHHSPVIDYQNHAAVRQIRALQSREERDRTGLFIIEGIKFLSAAVRHAAAIETLVIAPHLLVNPFGQKLVRFLRRSGVPTLDVVDEVFHRVSLGEERQGVIATVRQRIDRLSRTSIKQESCWVAMESVRSPGNLGTILRTGDAVGASGLILLGHGVDPYEPGCVRASMGSLFAQRIVRTRAQEIDAWKRRHGVILVGTSPSARHDYREVDYRRPVVFFVGPERQGLSEDQQASCDVMVRIPMVGSADSLNLSIATSLMLYEWFRQRRPVEG